MFRSVFPCFRSVFPDNIKINRCFSIVVFDRSLPLHRCWIYILDRLIATVQCYITVMNHHIADDRTCHMPHASAHASYEIKSSSLKSIDLCHSVELCASV